MPAADAQTAKPTREEKKAGKRAKQQAAMDAKAEAEDRYFREQQAAMQRSGEAQKAQAGLEGAAADAHEAALFAKQGTQGIEFGKEWPKVEVSGPGSNSAKALTDFANLGASLPPFLARNISLMNYRTPTPIQQHAVPLALAGCDLMCCAQTGSGKTAAFLVPIVSALTADARGSTVGSRGAARPRAVVMAPTRELASQIELEAQKLTNRSALRPVAVYGGADQRAQARALALGCDVVVATPGRLLDFVSRGLVQLSGATFLVRRPPCDCGPLAIAAAPLPLSPSPSRRPPCPRDDPCALPISPLPWRRRRISLAVTPSGAGRGGPHARHGLRAAGATSPDLALPRPTSPGLSPPVAPDLASPRPISSAPAPR